MVKSQKSKVSERREVDERWQNGGKILMQKMAGSAAKMAGRQRRRKLGDGELSKLAGRANQSKKLQLHAPRHAP
jgi:hypothetical protein